MQIKIQCVIIQENDSTFRLLREILQHSAGGLTLIELFTGSNTGLLASLEPAHAYHMTTRRTSAVGAP